MDRRRQIWLKMRCRDCLQEKRLPENPVKDDLIPPRFSDQTHNGYRRAKMRARFWWQIYFLTESSIQSFRYYHVIQKQLFYCSS